MATRDRRPSRGAASAGRQRARSEEGVLPVLAKAVRDIELAVQRGRVRPATRAAFQAVALLVREERGRVQTAETSESYRAEQLKRIDGVATILARAAARDSSLLALLTDDAELLPATRGVLREMREAAGLEPAPEQEPAPRAAAAPASSPSVKAERQVVPQSVISRQLANPFLAPDFSAAPPPKARPRLLANWELLNPLLRSFENAAGGAVSCMDLPEPPAHQMVSGRELMPHQAQVVAAAADGHRSFLLADEPGLGKTAQALLAAEAAARVPAAGGRAERRQDQLGPRGRPVDAAPPGHRRARRRRHDRRLLRRGRRQLRGAGPARRLARAASGSAGWSSTRRTSSRTSGSQRSRHVLELSERIRLRTVGRC